MSEVTKLSQEQLKIINENLLKKNESLSQYATKNPLCKEEDTAIRFRPSNSNMLLRTSFSIDVDKIINSVFYNRYNDKTQVFSFYRNDDITRRGTHVQLVARISRTIGSALNLNTDLIEAIALGHDIGHTPFGHVGEDFLNQLYFQNAGKYFNHNVQSVRNMLEVFDADLTIPTYDGIICHNGEKEFTMYLPSEYKTQDTFMEMYEKCFTQKGYISTLRPCTMEGCVVRLSDIIAYIMKDRQDAEKLGMTVSYDAPGVLGLQNYQMLDIICENIVANSYNKPYIKMDDAVSQDLSRIKQENYDKIYLADNHEEKYNQYIKPMMERMYYQFKEDIEKNNRDSIIFRHHIYHKYFQKSYLSTCSDDRKILDKAELIQDTDDIVMDFIASMTDDYFLDAYAHLFEKDKAIENLYISYFN